MGHPDCAGLTLFEDEEVILAVGLGEGVAGYLVEAGRFYFGAEDGFVEAVVGAVAVAVDDAEAGSGLEGGAEVGEHELGMGDLVVDLQHEGGVEGVGGEVGIVGGAEEGMDVGEALAGGAVADGGDSGGIDVFGDDGAGGADTFRGADGEPAATGADVGYCAAGVEVEEIHDVVDLEALIAARLFEDAEISGVGGAGGVGWRRGGLGGHPRGEGEG